MIYNTAFCLGFLVFFEDFSFKNSSSLVKADLMDTMANTAVLGRVPKVVAAGAPCGAGAGAALRCLQMALTGRAEPYARGSGSSGKACVRKGKNMAQGEEEGTKRMRNSGMGNAKAKGIAPWQSVCSLQPREGSDWSRQTSPEGAAAPAEHALGRGVRSEVGPGKG